MANIDNLFRIDDGISLNDEIGIFQGSLDPSISGFEAPIGSFYIRNNGTTYSKTSAPDTGWSLYGFKIPSPSTSIYVSTGGDDTNGDGSVDKPYLTVKKGCQEAEIIGNISNPVSVKILEGVYNEINPISVSNPYVKIIGGDRSRTIIKPTVNGQPLFILSSSGSFNGPVMSMLTLKGDQTYKTTSGGTLLRINGDGVFAFDNLVTRSGYIGYETGHGTITTDQITILMNSASIGNSTGISTNSSAITGVQFYMGMADEIAIQSNNSSEIQLSTYNIQGTPAAPSIANIGIIANDTSKILATNGVITRCSTGLQTDNTSNSRFIAVNFVSNTIDFNQINDEASIQIQGTLSKSKQLITNGTLVSLNYTDADTGDFIVGAAEATGIPGKEFRVRDDDGRIAVGDNATNENITSGGIGGPRSFNLIDSNGNLRIWRFVNGAGVDPALEFIKGINPINVDSVGSAPIVSIDAATDTITINVAGTNYNEPLDNTPGVGRSTLSGRAFPPGRIFKVNGTTSNDGIYTVVSATYNSGLQTISIVVTNDITINEGAVGTVVFGGGAGRSDGANPNDPATAITNGTGNVWWDMFLQESDYFVVRRRTGGGGSTSNEKLRIYADRTEIIGSTVYDDNDAYIISTFQHNANAVNNFNFENSSTGNSLNIEAIGTDTNIDINILPKGNGVISVNGTTNYENNVTHDDDIPNKAYVDNGDVISLSTINGQLIPTYIDTTRANKILSVETSQFVFSEDVIGDADWVQIGLASDADSGYLMPLNGTIVGSTGHCENTNGVTKDIDLFIDAVNNGSIGQFTGAGERTFNNTTININVDQGQKLRLRGRAGQGTINDTIITLRIKWRA